MTSIDGTPACGLLELRSSTEVVLLSYLEAMIRELGKPDVLLGASRPERKDLWIQTRAIPAFLGRGRPEAEFPDFPGASPPARPLNDFASEHGLLYVFGISGSGKSEWMRRQALGIAVGAHRAMIRFETLPDHVAIPIFLRLYEVAAALDQGMESSCREVVSRLGYADPTIALGEPANKVAAAVIEAVRRQLKDVSPMSVVLERLLWQRLTQRRNKANESAAVYLFVDAWDESSEISRRVVAKCLRPFTEVSHCCVRLAARSGYIHEDEPPLGRAAAAVSVELWGLSELEEFIRRFLSSATQKGDGLLKLLRERPEVYDLARVPLLGVFVAKIYEATDDVPVRRSDLYEKVLRDVLANWVLGNRPLARDAIVPKVNIHLVEHWFSTRTMQDWLFDLVGALATHVLDNGQLDRSDLFGVLSGPPGERKGLLQDADVGRDLRTLVDRLGGVDNVGPVLERLGLLRPAPGLDSWGFLHPSFRNWLAAYHLSHRDWRTIRHRVKAAISWPAWDDTIILLREQMKDTAPIDELLAESLKGEDSFSRSGALNIVGRLGSLAATPIIIEALASVLRHADWRVRNATVCAVGRIGSIVGRPEIVNGLWESLHNPEPLLRANVCEVVAQWGSSTHASAPLLLKALATGLLLDRDLEVSERMLVKIREIGADAGTPWFLDLLAFGLRNSTGKRRSLVAAAVAAIGPTAGKPLIAEALASALWDSDTTVRRSAEKAFRSIGAGAATTSPIPDRLCEGLSARAPDYVRVSMARVVGGIGSVTAAFPAIRAELFAGLRDESLAPTVRRAMANAIHSIWPGEGLQIPYVHPTERNVSGGDRLLMEAALDALDGSP